MSEINNTNFMFLSANLVSAWIWFSFVNSIFLLLITVFVTIRITNTVIISVIKISDFIFCENLVDFYEGRLYEATLNLHKLS